MSHAALRGALSRQRADYRHALPRRRYRHMLTPASRRYATLRDIYADDAATLKCVMPRAAAATLVYAIFAAFIFRHIAALIITRRYADAPLRDSAIAADALRRYAATHAAAVTPPMIRYMPLPISPPLFAADAAVLAAAATPRRCYTPRFSPLYYAAFTLAYDADAATIAVAD